MGSVFKLFFATTRWENPGEPLPPGLCSITRLDASKLHPAKDQIGCVTSIGEFWATPRGLREFDTTSYNALEGSVNKLLTCLAQPWRSQLIRTQGAAASPQLLVNPQEGKRWIQDLLSIHTSRRASRWAFHLDQAHTRPVDRGSLGEISIFMRRDVSVSQREKWCHPQMQLLSEELRSTKAASTPARAGIPWPCFEAIYTMHYCARQLCEKEHGGDFRAPGVWLLGSHGAK
ncbi:uncharacterized protein ACDP82_019720 [Pangshura tecta]